MNFTHYMSQGVTSVTMTKVGTWWRDTLQINPHLTQYLLKRFSTPSKLTQTVVSVILVSLVEISCRSSLQFVFFFLFFAWSVLFLRLPQVGLSASRLLPRRLTVSQSSVGCRWGIPSVLRRRPPFSLEVTDKADISYDSCCFPCNVTPAYTKTSLDGTTSYQK